MYLTELLRNSSTTGSLSETSLSNKAKQFRNFPDLSWGQNEISLRSQHSREWLEEPRQLPSVLWPGIKPKTAIESTHIVIRPDQSEVWECQIWRTLFRMVFSRFSPRVWPQSFLHRLVTRKTTTARRSTGDERQHRVSIEAQVAIAGRGREAAAASSCERIAGANANLRPEEAVLAQLGLPAARYRRPSMSTYIGTPIGMPTIPCRKMNWMLSPRLC